MNKLTILFDLDDTLIPTQEKYNETKEKALQYVVQATGGRIQKTTILDTFERADKENVSVYGFSKERFPTSWVQTLQGLKETRKEEERELYHIASAVFEEAILSFPEATSVLEKLIQKGYELSLVTAGDETVQKKRVKDAALSSYFKHVHILPIKTPETMKKLLKKTVLHETVMIGNSLRSDIYPSLKIGMKAIHIERETWGYDAFDVNKQHENYLTTTLQHVPEIIDSIEYTLKGNPVLSK